MRTEIHVFAGPTLPASVRASWPDVIFHPPARAGSVLQLVARRPLAIGLLDGLFEHTAAVWHKELLWALSEGIHVLGAASMGALRAAELTDFGMTGVGRIFLDFLEGRLNDDDEVAVVHGDVNADYRLGSDAMVNIRATLQRALELGVASTAVVESLCSRAKSQFYPDRSYASLVQWARTALPLADVEPICDWLGQPGNRVDLKRADALLLLEAMRSLRHAEPPTVAWTFQRTDAWTQLCRHTAARSEGLPLQSGSEQSPSIRREAALRATCIELAERDGFVPSELDRRAAMSAFCREWALTDQRALVAWLEQRGMSGHELDELMTDEARVQYALRVYADAGAAQLQNYLRLQPSGGANLQERRDKGRRGEHGARNRS